MEIGVRSLKAHLSEHLRSVRDGTHIVITDRGVPIAKLEPIEPPPPEILELVRAGKLIWKGRPPRGRRPTIKLKPGAKTMSDYVSDQRR